MKLGKTLILGDSYSTFSGYIPGGYHSWYSPEKSEKTDVTRVEQTWWYQVFDGRDNILVRNDSFSGSTVCNTVRPNLTVETSFISRLDRLIEENFFAENGIETVIVFGYTNDATTLVPFGEIKYENFTQNDLLSFCPACAYLASRLKEASPSFKVLWLLNTDTDEKFPNAVKTIADHFGQKYLDFECIEKQWGHPNINGMKQIAKAVKEYDF